MTGPRTTLCGPLLAFSDLHLDAGQDHRRDALADQENVLDQIAALAIERECRLVLNAGDTFHRAKPDPAALHVFKRFCGKLADAGIPMVALSGNGLHEAAPGQRSALELFESRLVRVSRTPEYITEFGGVAVCTLPASALGRLAAARNGGPRAELAEEAIDLLLAAAHNLYEQAPDDRPRILLAHQMVTGASLPTGLPVEQVGSCVLPLWALEEIGYDAIILGDLHMAQVLSELPFAAYCGSPWINDFGEQGNESGVWILDPEHPADYEFVKLQDRRFVTVDVDLTQDSSVKGAVSHTQEEGPCSPTPGEVRRTPEAPGMRAPNPESNHERCGGVAEHGRAAFGANNEPDCPPAHGLDETDLIAAEIVAQGNGQLEGAVVRMRYRASEAQHRRVDHAALLRLLDDAGVHKLYGGLAWEPVREQQTRVAAMDETLAPLAALDLWLAAELVGEPEAGALRALLGEWAQA